MKKIIFMTLLLITGFSFAKEPVFVQDAIVTAKELGITCQQIKVAGNACVIAHFLIKSGDSEWIESTIPADGYRVFYGQAENGALVVQDFYDNGQKQSDTFASFEQNAVLHLSEISDLKITQKDYGLWHRNGAQASLNDYIDGTIDGKHVTWYDNGQKQSERNFLKGTEVGHSTYWYDNGQKWLEESYENGEQHGTWTSWYRNGNKSQEHHYVHGEQIGLWTDWYENGQKQSERDLSSRVWQSWYENGQKEISVEFIVDNPRRIKITFWDDNGMLIQTALCYDSACVDEKINDILKF